MGHELDLSALAPHLTDIAFAGSIGASVIASKMRTKKQIAVWDTINEPIFILLAVLYTVGTTFR